MRFVIIASGFNCLEYAKKCYESYCKIEAKGEWMAVLISDGSTDGTSEFVDSIQHPNIKGLSFSQNNGAAFARHHAIKSLDLDDEDVIILAGLDDEIFPDALTEINKHYENGKWMTYGNWQDENGTTLQSANFNIEFSDEIHANRDYRKDVYRSTALNTFKYFLYKRIPEDDLKTDGNWIVSTTESEVMFSCLEMCGRERIGIVWKVIYLYNRYRKERSLNRIGLGNQYRTNRGRKYKYDIYNIIINRPKREQLFL